MKEQLISFKTAKLAKEKGFDELCSKAYTKDGTICYHKGIWYDSNFEKVKDYKTQRNSSFKIKMKYSAPTQPSLQKWLREEHDFHIEISLNSENPNNNYETMWDYAIYIISTNTWVHSENETHYHTFEDCKENALYKTLTEINKNQK